MPYPARYHGVCLSLSSLVSVALWGLVELPMVRVGHMPTIEDRRVSYIKRRGGGGCGLGILSKSYKDLLHGEVSSPLTHTLKL